MKKTLALITFLTLSASMLMAENPPGGDVLKPKRSTPDETIWYIGLDGGLTWSNFINGPISFWSRNPHNSSFPLESTIDDGNGVGFYFGGTLDVGFSKVFGLQFKVNVHTRNGSFSHTQDLLEIHPGTQTNLTSVLKDDVDLTFTYIGVDVLARIQVIENSLYLLIGPSFGSLSSNTATLHQQIVRPDDVFYVEEDQTVTNRFRQANSEAELTGFKSSRFDLKAGVGTWIPLTDRLFLTPEVTVAYPLTTLLETPVNNARYLQLAGAKSLPSASGIFDRVLRPSNPQPVSNDLDFNMITFNFTVGLRWQL